MTHMVPLLVVEDEAFVLIDLQSTLEDSGYTVLTATSAKEAFKLLEERIADIRGLITDIDIGPGDITGWDVAQRAREAKPELPVVYMTGASADQWAARGVPNSILIPKPFAPAQMITAVSQLLNSASHIQTSREQ